MKIGNFQILQNQRFCGPKNPEDLRIFKVFKFVRNYNKFKYERSINNLRWYW